MGSHSDVFSARAPLLAGSAFLPRVTGRRCTLAWGKPRSARAPPWGVSEGLDPSQPHPVDPSPLLSWPGLGPGGENIIDHLILPGSELRYGRKNVFFLTTFSHVRFHLPWLGLPGI